MYKLTYIINYSFSDEFNYYTSKIDCVDFVYAETIDDLVEQLIIDLKNSKLLQKIIDKDILKKEFGYSLEILSFDKVTSAFDLELYEHSLFKEIFSERKKELEEQTNKENELKLKLQREHELKELARLQEKYNCKK